MPPLATGPSWNLGNPSIRTNLWIRHYVGNLGHLIDTIGIQNGTPTRPPSWSGRLSVMWIRMSYAQSVVRSDPIDLAFDGNEVMSHPHG